MKVGFYLNTPKNNISAIRSITRNKGQRYVISIGESVITGSTIKNSTIDFSTPEGIQLLKDRVIELEEENERLRKDKINLEKLVDLMGSVNK